MSVRARGGHNTLSSASEGEAAWTWCIPGEAFSHAYRLRRAGRCNGGQLVNPTAATKTIAIEKLRYYG